MLKAVKVRLYLDKEQTNKINNILGCCRFVYNQCLNYAIESYEKDKTNISTSNNSKYFHGVLRNQYDWLKLQNTKIIKQSILDQTTAFQNFFKHKSGFPNFKTKSNDNSCRFPIGAISSKNLIDGKLHLISDFKNIKFKCSDRDREYIIKNRKSIRSITITKTKSGKYIASILVDGDLNRIAPKPINHAIGLDLGIKSLLVSSNGDTIENQGWYKDKDKEKELKKLQRQLSRKVKGSNNRKKARLKFAKKHEEIKNKKLDFIHNLTTKIINENQVIVIEDLNVKGMLKNHKLAKAIQSMSWGEFRRQLEYKAKWYGRELVVVDRFYASSKTCSCCKNKKKELKLSERQFNCENCGVSIDRDINAAINIKNEGLRILGIRCPESTLVDLPLMESSSLLLDSNVRLKQEIKQCPTLDNV